MSVSTAKFAAQNFGERSVGHNEYTECEWGWGRYGRCVSSPKFRWPADAEMDTDFLLPWASLIYKRHELQRLINFHNFDVLHTYWINSESCSHLFFRFLVECRSVIHVAIVASEQRSVKHGLLNTQCLSLSLSLAFASWASNSFTFDRVQVSVRSRFWWHRQWQVRQIT